MLTSCAVGVRPRLKKVPRWKCLHVALQTRRASFPRSMAQEYTPVPRTVRRLRTLKYLPPQVLLWPLQLKPIDGPSQKKKLQKQPGKYITHPHIYALQPCIHAVAAGIC